MEPGVVLNPASSPRWSHYFWAVLIATVATILITFGLPAGIRYFLICLNPKCGDFASNVAVTMEPEADPCDDFYNFVCKHWSGTIQNNFVILQGRVIAQVFKGILLYDAEAASSSAITAKATGLFQICAQGAFMHYDDIASIRETLDEYGLSWPPRVHAPPKDVVQVLVNLSLARGIPVLFQLSPALYFKKRDTYSLHFQINQYILEWAVLRQELRKYGTLMAYYVKTAEVMSRDTPLPSQLIERLVLMDNEIFSAMGVNSGGRPLAGDALVYVPFSQLDNFTGNEGQGFNFLEAINRHLAPSKQLNPDDELTVWSPKASKFILRLVAHYRDSITLYAYISLTLLRQLALTNSFTLSQYLFAKESSFVTFTYMLGKCLEGILVRLPYVLDRTFIRHWLQERDIDAAALMVTSVRNATEAGFATLSWMDDATRKGALGRIQTLQSIIGFPNQLLDEKTLEAEFAYVPPLEGSYFNRSSQLSKARQSFLLSLLNSSVHLLTEPPLPMILVNAFYLPIFHIIVIPGAIMFSPFFSLRDSKAVYYGSLGHVVGHEVTHAFDPDLGSYDTSGIRKDYWSSATRNNFDARVQCLRDLYNRENLNPDVNYGDEALTENFADCGGMDKAYRAFKKTAADQDPVKIAGVSFTEDQLFFLSSCYKWCSSDGGSDGGVSYYSPLRLRCNVPLMNLPQFAQAFRCPAGSRMNPKERCDLL